MKKKNYLLIFFKLRSEGKDSNQPQHGKGVSLRAVCIFWENTTRSKGRGKNATNLAKDGFLTRCGHDESHQIDRGLRRTAQESTKRRAAQRKKKKEKPKVRLQEKKGPISLTKKKKRELCNGSGALSWAK